LRRVPFRVKRRELAFTLALYCLTILSAEAPLIKLVPAMAERLRAVLAEEPELPERLGAQIDRLRQFEEQSPSIIPNGERWDKSRR
jgi:hypothetical protein